MTKRKFEPLAKKLGPAALAARAADTRTERAREGDTEALYFATFRPAIPVVNAKCNTLSVVERAIEERNRHLADGDDIDDVWCVFDHDHFEAARIREAFRLAAKEGIEIAFSNLAFEVWLILHKDFLTSALSNDQLCEKLKNDYGSYHKADTTFLNRLMERTNQAVANARKLYARYEKWDPLTSDPSTTVFRLVERLTSH